MAYAIGQPPFRSVPSCLLPTVGPTARPAAVPWLLPVNTRAEDRQQAAAETPAAKLTEN
jgi:hypothetical protein